MLSLSREKRLVGMTTHYVLLAGVFITVGSFLWESFSDVHRRYVADIHPHLIHRKVSVMCIGGVWLIYIHT